jgi:hypothetical protein
MASLEAREGAIAQIKLIEGDSSLHLPGASLAVSDPSCLADCESGAN